MSFFEKNKYIIATFGVLLVITAISGAVVFKKPVNIPLVIQTQDDNPPYEGGHGGSLEIQSTEVLKTPPTPPARGGDNKPPFIQTSTTASTLLLNTNTTTEPVFVPPAEETVPGKQSDNLTVSTTLIVEGKNYSLKIPDKSSAYDLMIKAQEEQYLAFGKKSYGELGYLIDEINGRKNSTTNHKFWIYYINGKKARIGVSAYIIHEGDVIEWKYEDEE